MKAFLWVIVGIAIGMSLGAQAQYPCDSGFVPRQSDPPAIDMLPPFSSNPARQPTCVNPGVCW